MGPYWCGNDGEWREAWLDAAPPAAAKVAVLRHDFKEPLWGVARFQTYVQKTKTGEPTNFWRNMPEVMIAKVAEATALSRAFPMETSGLYTSEVMVTGAEEVEVVEPELRATSPATPMVSALAVPTEIWRNWEHIGDALIWGASILPELTPSELQELFDSVPAVNGKKAPAFVQKVLSIATTF